MAKEYHDAYVRLRSKPTGRWLVHPDLRTKLVEDAHKAERTLTDMIVGILADRYDVEHAGRTRRARRVSDDGDVLKLRIPIDVWRAVSVHAATQDRDPNDVIRHALCSHYGLTPPALAA